MDDIKVLSESLQSLPIPQKIPNGILLKALVLVIYPSSQRIGEASEACGPAFVQSKPLGELQPLTTFESLPKTIKPHILH
jgi:hypothetical protein